MKTRRTSVTATAAAGVLVLGTFIGVTGAGTASAASYTHLCVDNVNNGGESICADADGSGQPIAMLWSGDPSISETNWYIPAYNGGPSTIQQANTTMCMQLEHQDSSGDVVDIVRLAPCEANEAAEEWINSYDTYDGTDETQLISVWAQENYGANYCLTWLHTIAVSEAVIDPCSGGNPVDDWRSY